LHGLFQPSRAAARKRPYLLEDALHANVVDRARIERSAGLGQRFGSPDASVSQHLRFDRPLEAKKRRIPGEAKGQDYDQRRNPKHHDRVATPADNLPVNQKGQQRTQISRLRESDLAGR
jgi:hypothetical protein